MVDRTKDAVAKASCNRCCQEAWRETVAPGVEYMKAKH